MIVQALIAGAAATQVRPLPPALARLRADLIARGVTASSPDKLDPEAERIAREEKWS